MPSPEKMKQLLEDYRRLSALSAAGTLSDSDRQTLELVRDVLLEAGALLESEENPKLVPRVPRAPVSLEVQFLTQGDMARALTRDVGPGGLALATERPLPVGSTVNLRVKIPDWSAPLAAVGEVMWVNGGMMGISFKNLPAQEEQRLKDLVIEKTTLVSRLTAALKRDKDKAKPVNAAVSGWATVLLRLSDEVLADVTAELLGVNSYVVFDHPPADAKPDVLVADTSSVSALAREFKGTPIVLVNVAGPEALVGELATLRPRGFVRRPASPARIVDAVRCVVRPQ